jgi:hypothetical protein
MNKNSSVLTNKTNHSILYDKNQKEKLPKNLDKENELKSVELIEKPSSSGEKPSLSSEAPSLSSEAPSLSSEAPSLSSEAPSLSSEAPSLASEKPPEISNRTLRPRKQINYNIKNCFKNLFHNKNKITQKRSAINQNQINRFINELSLQVLINLKPSKYNCCGGSIPINKSLFDFFKYLGITARYKESIIFNNSILNKIETVRYNSNFDQFYFVAGSFEIKIRSSKKLNYQNFERNFRKKTSSIYFFDFIFNKNRRLY